MAENQPYIRSSQPSLPNSQRLWLDNEFKKIEQAFRSVATETGGTITGIGSHAANTVLAGPASGADALPSFRALVGDDLPFPSATSLGGVQSISPVASHWISGISLAGVPSVSQPSFADLTGFLAPAQMPNPTATTLGGIKSSSAATHQFVTGLTTSGALTYAQPSAADVSGLATSATTDATNAGNISSGTLSGARLPTPTATVLGGVKSATAAPHQFATGIDLTGALTFVQPAASDITGLAASATTDTTNAGNISSGLLAIARGGTGTATPGIVAGASIAVTGSWPNQTVALSFGTQSANFIYGGPASGAAAAPAFRALVAADLPGFGSGDVSFAAGGGLGTIANAAVTYAKIQNVSATSRFLGRKTTGAGSPEELTATDAKTILAIASSDVSGLAASATTDTTNAANISSGTLNASRLPTPTATTLGGVKSLAAVSHKFITSIGTDGLPVATQPAASDITGLAASATTDTTSAANISTGTLSGARLPTPTATVLGGVKSATAASHQFATGIDTTGALTFAQPAASDISGLGSLATLNTVNNSNWSGTVLSVANGGTGDSGTAWTTYTSTVTAGTGTFTTVSGTIYYKQIGKTVFMQIQIVVTSNGSASGNIFFSLPVNVSGASGGFYYGISREEAGVASNPTGYVRFATDDPSRASIQSLTNTYMGGTGAVIRASGVYQSV